MASSSDAASSEAMALALPWASKDFTVSVCADDTVGGLKRRICELTDVLPKRQKMLSVDMGTKPAEESSVVSAASLKPGVGISMMGNVEDETLVDPVDDSENLDDFELEGEEIVDQDADFNKVALLQCIDEFKLNFLNRPRPGKKLLVLDIDFTLLDCHSENEERRMRPYLHEFLLASYSAYDIMIWSITSMRLVNKKLNRLGVLNNPNYKITALLDQLAVIFVESRTHAVFNCKPLGVIWAKCREFYLPGNTIMIDDRKLNFAMNPQNGLVIKPYRETHLNGETDNELVGLTQYLLEIAELDSLSELDHQRWGEYTGAVAKLADN